MAKGARIPSGLRIPIIGCLGMIGILFLSESTGLAQRTAQWGTDVEGFGPLKWGTSIEQASKTYPDLGFERYVVNDGKEEPWKVYVRGGKRGDIENVTFDSIEYWFKRGLLHQVRAVLHSSIGPRTLLTQAERAFEKLTGRLKERYGAPSDQKIDTFTEFVVIKQETTWALDNSAITVQYEGPGRTNEDLLIVILQEKAGR